MLKKVDLLTKKNVLINVYKWIKPFQGTNFLKNFNSRDCKFK